MIDIFNDIKPSVITRDLSGKSFLIYGEPKTGKTSNAVLFPKHLIIGFEKGWNLLGNVMGVPVNTWREALSCKKQLMQDAEAVTAGKKAETTYKSIIVDTASLAYDKCEQYILDKENAEYLDETESKRGYKAVQKEFDNFFQELVKAGYTVIAICHADTKQIKDNKEKYERIVPKIDKRGNAVLSGLCDVVAYAHEVETENGDNRVVLTMRGSKYIQAGTRSKYMSEQIPFTYEALLADMQQAIDQEASHGVTVTNEPTTVYKDQTEKRDYKEVKKEINDIAKTIAQVMGKEVVTDIIAKYLGRDSEEHVRTVSNATANQLDQLELILSDLKDINAQMPTK